MPRPSLSLLLLPLALAGCAEAAASPALPPPRPPAWQQFCEQATSVPHASALVAARGNDGWELVAMYNGVLCYKRPAVPAAEMAARPQPSAAPQPVTPQPGVASPPARDPGF